MDNNKNIENKIKETFDGQKKQAPADLWNKVSDNLSGSTGNKNIEEKIKNVFEKADRSAPPFVWGNVNKQLNIDKVWDKISKELDRRPVIYWRNIASIMLFLLLLSAGFYRYNLSVEPGSISNIVTQQTQINNKVSAAETKMNNALKEHSSSGTVIKKEINNSVNNAVSNQTRQPISGNDKTINRTISHNNTRVNEHTIVIAAQHNSLKTLDTFSAGPLTDNEPVQAADLTSIPSFSILINENDPVLDLQPVNTDALYGFALPVKQKRFELGLTYSYNNTWILNSETEQSFKANSLTTTSPAFAGSYGLVAGYNFSKNNALTTEFYINSRSQQRYGEFIEGKYYIHTLRFNYTKLTVLYQLNIHQSSLRKIPSKFTVKAGFYGSYLKNFSHTYNDIVGDQSDRYTKTDHGIKLAFGQEKTIKSIILGYGINSEYGFNNNFAGNRYMPATFNITKNALVGGYLNIKYGF